MLQLSYSFTLGFLSAIAGYSIATLYFSAALDMTAAGFITLGLARRMGFLLKQNRKDIWLKQRSPWNSNAVLCGHLVLLFFGILLGSVLWVYNLGAIDQSSTADLFLAQKEFSFFAALKHNSHILASCVVLSLFYRGGGLILIIGWNAIRWSNLLSALVVSKGFSSAILSTLSVLPYLFSQVVAYTLAGLAGVFISKAITKYKWRSAEFMRVAKACLLLFIISEFVLLVSSYLEKFAS